MGDGEHVASFERPAGAYDRFMGRYAGPLARAFAERAGVAPGRRALDVGCGPGALTAVLADIAGAGCVAAVDPSESFSAACRDRVPGADVRTAAAEALPFADAEFDATLSQLVVNFLTDADAAVREMRRVTRRGGTIAAAVWDYAGEMTMLRAFWDAAVELDPDATALDEGRRFPVCRPERLAQLWTGAGIAGVTTGAIAVSVRYEDFDDLWEPFGGGVGPSGSYFTSLPAERREALAETYRRRLGSPSGSFELPARAWMVAGTAP